MKNSFFFRTGYVTRLLPIQERHLDKYMEWYYDFDYRFFFRDFDETLTREKAVEIVRCQNVATTPLLIIEERETSQPVGVMTYTLEKPSAKIYKFGIMLEKNSQGKTWAIDAINILADFLFSRKKAHKIVVEFSASDKQIHRITEKGGFVHEATLKEELYIDGKYFDEFRFSLHEDRHRELYLHFFDGVDENSP